MCLDNIIFMTTFYVPKTLNNLYFSLKKLFYGTKHNLQKFN